MDSNKVIPLRPSPRRKEARLANLRGRFEQAHPDAVPRKHGGGSGRALVLALAIAALMIWFASWLGR